MGKYYAKIAKLSLLLVYLVIIAGAVVRMTGSGMGCPDWPKCFGYYIPPTQESELQWEPMREYKKGQVIILKDSLWVVKKDFVSGKLYNRSNWTSYTKHNYAVFNAAHTWTEFVNRLMGALAGLATLALAISSLGYWKKDKKAALLSWGVVLAMGFQGWLGAIVVFSVLEPVKITIHMVMALVIVALLLFLIHRTGDSHPGFKHDKKTENLFWIALGITFIQIVLGTQVRQFIDEQVDTFGQLAKNLWLTTPELPFYIHRSFSIGVVLLNLYLAYRIYKLNLGYAKINWVLLLLLAEIISGMAMNYLDFPFGTQPMHLVIASLLFGVQYYLVLEGSKAGKSHKTL
ncbi:MAG TPA: COX15/CtaA family protein [Eudoraea sp.]|nr:COX15/CtaA family protein [Eudoraea sp.]